MRAAGLPLAAAILAGALAGGAAAQVDPGAPEGARQTAHVVRDFDRYDVPIGPFALDERAVRPVEGAVTRSAWLLDDAQASVGGVIREYRERLAALGFEPVFDCAGEACGGFDFRFGAEILPPPAMLVDVRDFAQLTAEEAGGEGVVSVLVSRVLGTIYVQTVSVAPVSSAAESTAETRAEARAEPSAEPSAGPSAETLVEAPAAEAAEPPAAETGPDEQSAEALAETREAPGAEAAPGTATLPQDERALLERLTQDGHVPVQGLAFEVGGAGLAPEADEALDLLARALTQGEELAVAIVGHSDNQGGLELNLALSQRRAEAVMAALIERGVPRGRLEARGVAYLAPLASNSTEEGRARNRRVELVLR